MSYQIVVLNTVTESDGSFFSTGVFCLTAPSNATVPIPGFKSQNPYVDEPTLLGLQNGTLVEQSFNSGLFPSGTTLAAVQTQLQSLFTTAQTNLSSTSPALSNLVGSLYNGAAWSQEVAPNVFLTQASVLDFETSILLGRIPGAISGRAQGYVSTSSTSNTAVRATAYVPPGTNAQRSIVSTSANDTSAGTGAQQVTINYLDTSFVAHSETVLLSGLTPVNTVGTNIAYIENILVAKVGSGQINAGTINLMTGTAGSGSVVGSIIVGDQQTWWAHHYVPAGVTCYITVFSAGGTVVAGATNMIHQASLATAGAPTTQIGLGIVHPAGGHWDHEFKVPLGIAGPDLIWVNDQPVSATASKTVGGFEFIQF